MVVNRLQYGLLNSRIAPRASRLNCQNIFFFKREHILFFSNSDRDFYSENNYSEDNNISQVPGDFK
jgi:hypothetical protein